jgi:hypothetical protein
LAPAIIDGAMTAVGLLSWIALSKYVNTLITSAIDQMIAQHNSAITSCVE